VVLTAEQKAINIERRRQEKYNKTHQIIDGIDHKFCNNHYKYFPEENPWFPATLEYFYQNKTSKVDGLNPYCKRCGSQRALEQWKDDPIKHREAHKKYEKTSKFKQWTKKNREDQKEYLIQYRKDNKEKLNTYCKERRMHKTHNINKTEWQKCKEYFNNACAYCGLPVEDHYNIYKGELRKEDLQKEHVIHDGINDLSNCIPACKSCNSSKHESTLDEWYNENNPNFTEEKYNKIIEWITEDHKQYIMPPRPKQKYVRKESKKEVS